MVLDLNGIVKGQTVDDAIRLIAGDGFVCAGGDLATQGPLDAALSGGGAIRFTRGGLATSGSATRSWLRAGACRHHLIDPRTGEPADSPWQEVNVCAATCRDADVAAKAAFLLGHDGPRCLDERGLAGRFLLPVGYGLCNGGWLAAACGDQAA